MRNFKKLLVLTGMVFSSVVSASPELCGFEQLEGDIVEFTSSDKPRPSDYITSQLPTYRYFTADQAGDQPLNKEVYVGRKAVFNFSDGVTRTKTLTGGKGVETTHVFTGVADNCQQIFAQIKESDFPRYFDTDNTLYPNTFNFFREESTIGILFHSSVTYHNVTSAGIEADQYYVKPNMPFPMLFVDKHYQKTIIIPPYSTVDVIEIQYIPFTAKGQIKSDTRIKAIYDGVEGYLSGYREHLSNADPLAGVPKRFLSAIEDNKLMFGMHIDHILLSKGLPEHTQVFDVYPSSTGYKVDYDGTLTDRRGDAVGQVMHLIYDDIPYELSIDINGLFKQSKQVFGQPKFRGALDFIDWQ